METQTQLIDPLFERVEEYSKTSFKLLKFKSIDKTADIVSALSTRILFAGILAVIILTLNIAVSLWLGDLCGKNYYGFLLVASFYALVGIILYFFNSVIKRSVSNSIINNLLN